MGKIEFRLNADWVCDLFLFSQQHLFTLMSEHEAIAVSTMPVFTNHEGSSRSSEQKWMAEM